MTVTLSDILSKDADPSKNQGLSEVAVNAGVNRGGKGLTRVALTATMRSTDTDTPDTYPDPTPTHLAALAEFALMLLALPAAALLALVGLLWAVAQGVVWLGGRVATRGAGQSAGGGRREKNGTYHAAEVQNFRQR